LRDDAAFTGSVPEAIWPYPIWPQIGSGGFVAAVDFRKRKAHTEPSVFHANPGDSSVLRDHAEADAL
jgi:hypothetical protein